MISRRDMAFVLQVVIHRSQIDSLYLVERLYQLRPLHGGKAYMAFPSATTASATAILVAARLRPLGARLLGWFILLLIAGSLIVTNGHWAADIVGGLSLGWLIGSRVNVDSIQKIAALRERGVPGFNHARV